MVSFVGSSAPKKAAAGSRRPKKILDLQFFIGLFIAIHQNSSPLQKDNKFI